MKFSHLLFSLILLSHIELFSQSTDTFSVPTSSKENASLEIAVRIPFGYTKDTSDKFGIMVLFGGRNWEAKRTIETYKFDGLADRRKLFLLSLSFKDDEYWQPEKWSGKALQDALDKILVKYGLDRKKKLFYYGYSAGAQCVNLFLAWKPEIVEAWALHACGVWLDPDKNRELKVPGLATCGELDSERCEISMFTIAKMRENGCPVIWKSYPEEDHGLPGMALKLAEAFFESAISSSGRQVKFVGDDQMEKYFPADSKDASYIDEAYRNEFCDEKTAQLWAAREKGR